MLRSLDSGTVVQDPTDPDQSDRDNVCGYSGSVWRGDGNVGGENCQSFPTTLTNTQQTTACCGGGLDNTVTISGAV